MLLALAVVMVCSTLSALSGVGKGIKWLSNINMVLSFSLLAFFMVFGSTVFALKILGYGIVDYLIHLPAITFQVFPAEGAGSAGEWQGWWSIFYWAWWIAFAPLLIAAELAKAGGCRRGDLSGRLNSDCNWCSLTSLSTRFCMEPVDNSALKNPSTPALRNVCSL